jgi:hypothetical protein
LSKTIQAIPIERLQRHIFIIREVKVMLSSDLADLYGVEVKVLNQAVKRNKERFPGDFVFQLTHDEFINLKSQIVTSSWGGARRALPYAFTEHGILMLSSVLRSPRAVQVNIEIMRAFISLRELIASNATLARKLIELEKKYDAQFKVVFKALREILNASPPAQKQIGFRSEQS